MIKTVIVAYMVISGSTCELSDAVNNKIKEGWEPYGSIACFKNDGWGCVQPMVKKQEIQE